MQNIFTNLLKRRRIKFSNSFKKLHFNWVSRNYSLNHHNQIIKSAEDALNQKDQFENNEHYLTSTDPLIRQGWLLKKEVEHKFREMFKDKNTDRILIHIPSPEFSPAGYSLFTNLAESLIFLGIPVRILAWNEDIEPILRNFNPTVLLSSDHDSYLSRINWEVVSQYKQNNKLLIGLTASLEEYGSSPLKDRLLWAQKNDINFFYTFRDKKYVENRIEYQPFFEFGFNILNIPFGANILHYYPIVGIKRDIDFSLIATQKREHMSYLIDIIRHHSGFIDGPGWRHVKHFSFNRDRDRYIYARTKIGLNVHLPEQIEWACEVNERTYQLAACGVPQLIDHPKLIDTIFSNEALFVADTPDQYAQLFSRIIKDPSLAQQRALLAQKEVFDKHTTFHRAQDFLLQLSTLEN